MSDIIIRPAVESDIPRLEALLYQVHGLHAEGRPRSQASGSHAVLHGNGDRRRVGLIFQV